ncbi:MAG TPA: hypothetical protein PLJ34_05775, partial [Hyphomicrobiales bacterium]|nr:hypothetical protein [Hyphomicrobiales bacterium]
KELFPKNDFGALYRSGLDAQGVFDPKRADRSLLFNAEHPDANDPLHLFGVDEGEGYVEGAKRWRFIGAYLIYGQWKQGILHGIRALEKHDIAFGGIMLLFFAMSAGLWRLWRSTISRMTYPRGGLRR